MDYTKQYVKEGQVLTIQNTADTKETLRASLKKEYVAPNGDKYVETLFDSSDNDISNEINSLEFEVLERQKKITQLKEYRTKLRAELENLPTVSEETEVRAK